MRGVSLALCLVALAVSSIFLGAGTYTYYSDGAFTIDFSSPETLEPVISFLSPGETVYIIIKIPNRYSQAAKAWIRLKNVVCSENGVVEPEEEWYDLHGVRNDIDTVVTFGLWIDRDGEPSSCSPRDGDVMVIDEEEGLHVADVEEAIPLGRIPAGSSIVVVSSYHMDEETGNWAQSDAMTFDIERILRVPRRHIRPRNAVEERIPGDQASYLVDATDLAGIKVTLDTVTPVTVTILRYHGNPHPDDPIPVTALPRYVDVEVSDPDAVEWPIYLEMFYTDDEVEGLDEDSLGIYYWMDGEWQRCGATGVDTENNVVWAYMTEEEASGSPILIGGKPAVAVLPMLSDLTITPEEVMLGDEVTIAFDIENRDNRFITYNVTMQIGELTQLVDVELEAHESKTVTRTITPDKAGDYDVTVDGLTGSFTVKTPPKPAEFKVSDLEVEPEKVVEGEVVTITVEVENIGEEEGTHTVPLTVDRLAKEPVEVTLEGGESTTVTFTVTEAAGDHTVRVEDLTGSFTVTAPGISPGYVAGIIIVIIVAAAIVYAAWKRKLLPSTPR